MKIYKTPVLSAQSHPDQSDVGTVKVTLFGVHESDEIGVRSARTLLFYLLGTFGGKGGVPSQCCNVFYPIIFEKHLEAGLPALATVEQILSSAYLRETPINTIFTHPCSFSFFSPPHPTPSQRQVRRPAEPPHEALAEAQS